MNSFFKRLTGRCMHTGCNKKGDVKVLMSLGKNESDFMKKHVRLCNECAGKLAGSLIFRDMVCSGIREITAYDAFDFDFLIDMADGRVPLFGNGGLFKTYDEFRHGRSGFCDFDVDEELRKIFCGDDDDEEYDD